MQSINKGYITISYNPADQMVISKWLGYATTEQFREGMQLVLSLCRQRDVKFWLADNSRLTSIGVSEQVWLKEEMVPQLITSKLQKIARVVSQDMYKQLMMDKIVEQIKQHPDRQFELRNFFEADSALEWLMQK